MRGSRREHLRGGGLTRLRLRRALLQGPAGGGCRRRRGLRFYKHVIRWRRGGGAGELLRKQVFMEGMRGRHTSVARLGGQGALHPAAGCVRAGRGQEGLRAELLLLLLLLLVLDLLELLRGFYLSLLLALLTHLLWGRKEKAIARLRKRT